MSERLLTPHEVAEILAVPRRTLDAWRSAHVGPPGIKVGKHVRYRREAVEAWLDAQTEQRDPARRGA